jgi:tripartite-type tricarboxylate transporter receptor subunit TctC
MMTSRSLTLAARGRVSGRACMAAVAALAGACAALAAPLAQAAGYPDRPVRIIVSYPPGGTPDIIGRLLAARLTAKLGVSFLVENRAGASGSIGTQYVARSAPDGYTLMMGSVQTHALNASTFRALPYDPVKDFTPIIEVVQTPNVLIVNKDFPGKTVADLLASAKAHPGGINFGSTGTGSTPHLAGESLKLRTGIEMKHIPYKGAGPMLNDLLGGHIMMAFDNLPSSMGLIRSGSIRPLAVTTLKRSPAAPDIPTLDESGLPGFDVSSWFGVFGPGGMPADVTGKLNAEILAIMHEDAVHKRLIELGGTPIGNTPSEFAAKVRSEIPKWAEIVRSSGLEVQ